MSALQQSEARQDRIWDYFQNDAPEAFAGSLARVRHLLNWVKPGQRLLNVGCGTGLLEELASRKGVAVYSLDPSERAIQGLRDRLALGDRAQVGYIQNIPFSEGFFDCVIVSEVLEHLTAEVMDAGLRELRRVLHPNGRLLGTVPSRENLNDQLVVCPCCGKKFHRWGHEQRFDAPSLRRALGAHLDVEQVVERPFFPWSQLNWKGKLFAAAKWTLWCCGFHGTNENLVFIARPGRVET